MPKRARWSCLLLVLETQLEVYAVQLRTQHSSQPSPSSQRGLNNESLGITCICHRFLFSSIIFKCPQQSSSLAPVAPATGPPQIPSQIRTQGLLHPIVPPIPRLSSPPRCLWPPANLAITILQMLFAKLSPLPAKLPPGVRLLYKRESSPVHLMFLSICVLIVLVRVPAVPKVPPTMRQRSHSEDSVTHAAHAVVERAKTKNGRPKKASQHSDVIDRLDFTGVGPSTPPPPLNLSIN
jgi:hypothetical protein